MGATPVMGAPMPLYNPVGPSLRTILEKQSNVPEKEEGILLIQTFQIKFMCSFLPSYIYYLHRS